MSGVRPCQIFGSKILGIAMPKMWIGQGPSLVENNANGSEVSWASD
jgi:hypothetical protein